MGALGSGVAIAVMVEVLRGQKLCDIVTPNPITMTEVSALIEIFQSKLPPPTSWLHDAEGVIAIGGPNSIFLLARDILRAVRNGKTNSGRLPTADVLVNTSQQPKAKAENNGDFAFTPEDVWQALLECTEKSDEYLLRYLGFDHAEPPSLIVPKLALLYAVMTHTSIRSVKPIHAIGSCGGLLVTESFWNS
jgi:hypothetical protein